MNKDVLLVADGPEGLSAAASLLRRLGMRPRTVAGAHDALESLRGARPAFVVLDHWKYGLDPVGFLKLAAIEFPDLMDDVVVVSPTGSDSLRALLREQGAGIVVDGSGGDEQLLSVIARLAPTSKPPAEKRAPILPFGLRVDPRRSRPGELIADRFRVRKKLGSGSMATVYATDDEHLEERVALKLLHALQVTGAVRRFRRETRLAREIVHPNVVRTYEAGMWRGHPYLTMQLLQGQSLQERLPAGHSLPLAETLHISRGILQGLEAIHGRGVDHRDLSPSNVFLQDSGVPCILDFGAARLQDDSMGVQSGGFLIGTPAILPPERILGRDGPLGSADAWAFGVLLYRMLCGVGPFHRADPVDLLAHITAEEVISPRIVDPHAPESLSEAALGLLVKNPEERASLAVVKEAIAALDSA